MTAQDLFLEACSYNGTEKNLDICLLAHYYYYLATALRSQFPTLTCSYTSTHVYMPVYMREACMSHARVSIAMQAKKFIACRCIMTWYTHNNSHTYTTPCVRAQGSSRVHESYDGGYRELE